MAIPHKLAGINGATAVVIASAAIAAWATGMIAGGAAGIIAALLLALSPSFLYQSIQPMSDVPVTAAWMLCFLLLRGEQTLDRRHRVRDRRADSSQPRAARTRAVVGGEQEVIVRRAGGDRRRCS